MPFSILCDPLSVAALSQSLEAATSTHLKSINKTDPTAKPQNDLQRSPKIFSRRPCGDFSRKTRAHTLSPLLALRNTNCELKNAVHSFTYSLNH
jgi:hypothetical protein